ncbi:hypothetical protein HDU67_004009 [Dinochytrium kinnereticum]|nr:hypothetical protein HDU67_004009 [Dinochytrium kinnereticum]
MNAVAPHAAAKNQAFDGAPKFHASKSPGHHSAHSPTPESMLSGTPNMLTRQNTDSKSFLKPFAHPQDHHDTYLNENLHELRRENSELSMRFDQEQQRRRALAVEMDQVRRTAAKEIHKLRSRLDMALSMLSETQRRLLGAAIGDSEDQWGASDELCEMALHVLSTVKS